MKSIEKFIVVLLVLALAAGLVYSILSLVLDEFPPSETTKAPTETKEPTETTKPAICEHIYPDVYTDGKCSNCGIKCNEHIWDLNGKCDNCHYPCPHSNYTNSICNVCKSGCSHSSWNSTTGKCSTCNYLCLHKGGITITDSTCIKVGSQEINCSVCGFKKTTEIPKKAHTYGDYKPFDENEKEQHGKQCSLCKTWSNIVEHTFKNGVCSTCGYECSHDWSNGVCIDCEMTCSHDWSNGVCSTCGYECSHDWSNGVCIDCEMTCSHDWSNGVCSTCGYVHPHGYDNWTWVNGVCKICEFVCPHEDTHGNGEYCMSWYVCDDCETIIEDSIEYNDNHSYDENGVCYGCGKQES